MQTLQYLFVLLVLLHTQVCLPLNDCEWKAALSEFDNLGSDQNVFFRQHPVTSVASVFENLTDSAIDLNDRNSVSVTFQKAGSGVRDEECRTNRFICLWQHEEAFTIVFMLNIRWKINVV
uniref:CATSPERG N-terminal domain-containing protein n=1 Tax=Pelusios castaneus TaxID=367368 RepID=A0A8C8S3Q1_9SAUR